VLSPFGYIGIFIIFVRETMKKNVFDVDMPILIGKALTHLFML